MMGKRQGNDVERKANMPTFEDFDASNDDSISEQKLLDARGHRMAERAKQG